MVMSSRRDDDRFSPNLSAAVNYYSRTASGWGCSSREVAAAGPLALRQEDHFIQIEAAEDDPVYLRSSRVVIATDGDRKYVLEFACIALTYAMVNLSTALSTALDFAGNWDLAIAVTGLRGGVSYLRASVTHAMSPPYTDEQYRESTRASSQEMRKTPGVVVNRLLARFTRSIGVEQLGELQELLGRSAPARSGAAAP